MVSKRPYGARSRSTSRVSKRTGRVSRDAPIRAPVPTVLRTKMIYNESITINPAAGGIPGVYVFSANGMYDPNISGVGSQPRGFDQLMALYDHFVVTKAKIVATWGNNSVLPVLFGITLRDTSSPSVGTNDYMESDYTKYTVGTYVDAGGEAKMLSYTCNPNKFLGRRGSLSDPDLKGSTAANPVEQAYFHVWLGAIDQIGDLPSVPLNVRIEYECALIEPKMPGSS